MNELAAITAYIATRIKTVSGFTSENVFEDRYVGNAIKALPAVCIYHVSTERERSTFDGEYSCNSDIMVELYANAGESTVTAQINTLGALIAAAIESDRDFGGIVFNAYISALEDIFDENTDAPLGVRAITVSAQWLQSINNE